MPNWKKVIVSGSDASLNNITATGNVSGSSTSTSSFGTYLGDGSQLSGISTTPFPFTGDAQITGSLTVSSSFADFSGLTDIKTRKFAITSQLLDPGIKVISASFYDSFIESLDAAVDGDTIHVFANDSSSVVADSFSNKNITILGNGHTFTTDGYLNVHQRYAFTSCSLDIYDYTFFRDNAGNSSYPAASMWQIDKTTLNLYNTEFSASSGYALGINKDCVINGGKFVSNNTAIYGYSQPNDNVEIRNAEIESDKDGIVLVGDSIKVLNCDVLYHQDSATSSQTKAIVLTGNSCLIQNCNVEGDKEANYGSAVGIGSNTGASTSVRNEIQNLSINLGEIYAYGYTDIQGCNVFSEGNHGIYHSGTGSISDCSIEVPGNPNYGFGMYLMGDSLIRVSNVYSKGNNSGVTFSGRKQFFNCVFEGSSATYGSFDGNDVTDLEVSNLTLIAKGGPTTMNVQMSGSGKALINNVTSTIYNEGATTYHGGFSFKGSPDGTATLTNIACYFHSVGGDAGTSWGAQISQITGSTIDNFYSEGYKIGIDLDAISSSVSNVHTLLKTDTGGSSNVCSFQLSGDQNILTDNIFEIDKAHTDSGDHVVKILEGTHTFQNSRFKSAAATGQYLITGSANVSSSLINNIYEVADTSYITASNVTDITTGYIDGRGNWHESQVTSSFDHIEATSFKGDGSGLSNLPASDPFPYTGDAQITGSLLISGSFSAFTLDSDNVVLGSGAGTNMLAGADNNVVIGNSAGATLTDGDYNVIIGDGADTNASNTTYAVAIGKGAQVTNANVAIGYNVTAESYDSMVAIGSSGGQAQTTVVGKSSSTTGYGSQAFGYNIDSTATTAMTFGYNFTNALAGSFQVGSGAQKLTVTTNSNLLLNKSVTPTAGTHFDDSATNVITIGTGSAPDANVAHSVQLYAQTGSSEAGLQLRTSGGKIHTLADKVDFTTATAISGSTFSGSFAGDGSQLTNLPASDPFPYSGSAIISSSGATASLTLEGSGSTVFDVIGSQGTLFSVDDDLSGTLFTANDISGLPVLEASASGEVYIGKSPQSLYTTAVISSTTAATTQSIFGLSTSSYDGAFFDYTVQSGSNARAGNIMTVWNGSNISYTETTTTDIGDTTDFNLIVHISQSQAQIASHATNAGYKIKTIIRSI